jgi:hypothetical protein
LPRQRSHIRTRLLSGDLNIRAHRRQLTLSGLGTINGRGFFSDMRFLYQKPFAKAMPSST